MKLKPIPDAMRSWRYLTVQFGLFLTGFGALPADLQQQAITWLLEVLRIPPERVPMVLGIAVVVLRNIQQKKD